ncbi:MAG: alpha-2-macroglobulin family protein [Sandaracinaceae bacterium]
MSHLVRTQQILHLVTILALGLALGLAPSASLAQGARANVSRGGVDGLELALDGGLNARRGGVLRWQLTAYEVRGLSDLAPAANAQVFVTTSFAPAEESPALVTDALGHALAELAIPEDADDAFTAVVRIVHANGTQRRFDLPVRVAPRERVEVFIARRELPPGAPLPVFGSVREADGGRPIAGLDLEVVPRDAEGRPLAAPERVRTNPAGMFSIRFRLPREHRGQVSVVARTDRREHPVAASDDAMVVERASEPVLVAVAPSAYIVAPGAHVRLEVAVRTPEGRPIAGATVTLPGAQERDPERRARTDERGRATLGWTAPAHATGIVDTAIQVSAVREGIGQGTGSAPVRIARDPVALAFAVEGGALSPLGGAVFVRAVDQSGSPAAGIEIELSGPRLDTVRGMSDGSGAAAIEARITRAPDPRNDRCGGETATEVILRAATQPAVELRACLALDPDAAARVRVDRAAAAPGDAIAITVARAPGVSSTPVELTLIGDGPSVLASTILAADASSTNVTLPADAVGRVLVRARPLIGASRQPVRGGVAAVWVQPAPAFLVRGASAEGGARFEWSGGSRFAYVFASPIDEARGLRDRLDDDPAFAFGDLRVPLASASMDLVRGALAAQLAPDRAAPAVWRGGQVVPVPAPESPEQLGVLRDPWRARARFVSGRLALIIRALEQAVAGSLPDRVDDVAVVTGGRFALNAQILDAVAESGQLGAAGATGLGGDPLTLAQLRSFDAQIDYDHVARRITRERLFRLILGLRTFVQARQFDLPWSRLGDPSEWMRQLVGHGLPGGGVVTQADLVDGWGRPFALRPARGARSRYTFVDPLGAWEIVSPGPDGRLGTGDDQWDPAARILRAGSPYAVAVGEDLLVARLSGVELGRASVELLVMAEPRANVGYIGISDGGGGSMAPSWGALPHRIDPPDEPLALRRPARPGDGAGGRIHALGENGGAVQLDWDEEPRTWGIVAWVHGEDGGRGLAFAERLAGSALILEGEPPSRVRAGESAELELTITNVSDEPLAMRVVGEGDGVELRTADEIAIDPGVARPLRVTIVPDRTTGPSSAQLSFRAGDRVVRTLRFAPVRTGGGHPLRLRAGGLARGRAFHTHFDVPSDATDRAGRVVVLAPSALSADPDLAEIGRRDPALLAFADALASRPSDPALLARLLRQQDPSGLVAGDASILSSACAAVAWASAAEHDAEARAALTRVRYAVESQGDIGTYSPEAVALSAAVLGALAAGGVPTTTSGLERATDPLARVAANLRTQLRRVVRAYPEEPTLLARAAGALLLADPRDVYGLAMLDRAAEHLVDREDGGALVQPSERVSSELDALEATAALAVAAHQAGRPELAERLVRGVLARDHVATRAGGQPLFWFLANAAYGALGSDADAVEISVDGSTRRLALEQGRGVVALDPRRSDHDVRVVAPDGAAAFVRVESVMERPFVARDEGPYSLALEGDAGDLATGAAFELTVTARRAVGPTLVEISLPAGARLPEVPTGPSPRTPGSLELREPGLLRAWLGPMAEGASQTIALPLQWTVRGTLRGLGAVAYPLGQPAAMSAIAPRDVEVRAAPPLPEPEADRATDR